MQYVIAICSIIFSFYIISEQDKLVSNAYKSGFDAGVNSVEKEDVDKVCAKWMFDANMKEVKRKVCGK
jgi:hypothetical protein